jgi:hypothetical protein
MTATVAMAMTVAAGALRGRRVTSQAASSAIGPIAGT